MIRDFKLAYHQCVRKTTPKEILEKLIYAIIFIIVANFYFIWNLPDAMPNKTSSRVPYPWKHAYNDNKEFYNYLVNSTRFAYQNFVNACIGYDELMPNTLECMDTYGFHATIVESLETLYLLNQTDLYQHAREFIRQNLNCNDLGWINRNEMFSRLIGSLIGAFLLTSDEMYLQHAEQCTQNAIRIDTPFKYPKPFHNYKNMSHKVRMWVNGTGLKDVSSGLPEMVALYHITRKPVYLNYYLRIVKSLPKRKGFYYSVLTLPRGFNGTVMQQMDPFTAPFYQNIAIAHSLYPTDATEYSLNKTESITSMNYNDLSPLQIGMMPILDAASRLTNFKSQFLYGSINEHFDRTFEYYSECDKLADEKRFAFDASFLGILLRKGNIHQVQRCIKSSLEKQRMKNGFSGSFPHNRLDNVQYSDVLGQWLKMGALSIIPDKSLRNSILNDRGHILYSSSLLNLPKGTIQEYCSSSTNSRSYDLFCKE